MACADSIRLEEVEPTGPDPSPGNTKATTPDATHARPAITPPIAPHWTSLEVGIFSFPLSLAITASCHPKKPYSPKCLEGVSLLKKSASGWLRSQIGLETPQNRRIWCLIWDESVHRGSFSTGWGVLRTSPVVNSAKFTAIQLAARPGYPYLTRARTPLL